MNRSMRAFEAWSKGHRRKIVNIDYTRDIALNFGPMAALHDIAYRAANRLTEAMLLQGIKLDLNTLDPDYLETELPPDSVRWGFLGEAELVPRARAGEAELDLPFVEQALAKGDLCYGVIDGGAGAGNGSGTLASYGWYSSRPTPVSEGLTLHFDPTYAYMYKGFTLPAYRGKRLHGIGMARALEALVAQGKKGLVSYVKSNNFASLKSCYRMGYGDFGQIVVARLNGRYVTYATKGCAEYAFRVEVARD